MVGKIIKACVVGCGRMGVFTSPKVRRFAPRCWFPLSHAEAIASIPGMSLEALCDSNQSKLQAAGKKFPKARLYTDFNKLLESEKPDLLTIATRTPGRARLIAEAVAAGVRALHVEKPLCNSMAELKMLERLFRKRNLYVTYGTLRRYQKIYQHAVEIAHSGKYGKLLEVSAEFGAGTLAWCHPHSIDCLLFAARQKKIIDVQAHLGKIVFGKSRNHIRNDPLVLSGNMYFEDGLCGTISMKLGMDLVLSCEKAQITVRADGRSLGLKKLNAGGYFEPEKKLGFGKALYSGSAAPLAFLKMCLQKKRWARKESKTLKTDIINSQKAIFALIDSAQKKSNKKAFLKLNNNYSLIAETRSLYA